MSDETELREILQEVLAACQALSDVYCLPPDGSDPIRLSNAVQTCIVRVNAAAYPNRALILRHQ